MKFLALSMNLHVSQLMAAIAASSPLPGYSLFELTKMKVLYIKKLLSLGIPSYNKLNYHKYILIVYLVHWHKVSK